MPPKKKEPEKKGAEDPEPDEEEKELLEKELVISYLKSKLGRYQEQGERLQVENIKLTEELENQKLNLSHINEFLTNELKARSLTTTVLEEKLSDLSAALEETKRNHELELQRLRAEKDREISSLENAVQDYDRKIKQSQDFLDKKDALEAELQQLKDQLERRNREYEQKLSDLDRQHIQDREKWKREMMAKIKETKQQMMKLTDNQLELTTKRTIMENEQMANELAYQSRQTEKLIAKNQKLLDENADLRRQLELSKQTEIELAKRNNVYQKTIKTLLSKLKVQGEQAELEDELVEGVLKRLQELEDELHLSQLQAKERQAELDDAQATAQAKQEQLETLLNSFNDITRFLTLCRDDIEHQVRLLHESEGESAAEQSATGRLDMLKLEQRERILSFILERLHASQAHWNQCASNGATGGTQNSAAAAALSSALSPHDHKNLSGQASSTGNAHGVTFTWSNSKDPWQSRSLSGAAGQLAASSNWGTQSSRQMSTSQSMPSVEHMLGQLMSDVRPWGKKSPEPAYSHRGSLQTLRKQSVRGSIAASVSSSLTLD